MTSPRHRFSRRRSCRRSRRGAMIVMLAVGFVILLAAAAFSVDVAYMHLARAELHVATDVAAKAAVTGLALGGSEAEAKNQAIAYAAKNTVAGAPLQIDSSHVTLGKVTYISDSRWTFTAGETPLTAATVTVNMADGTKPGAVNLFFGRLFGRSTFSPTMTSTAAFVRNKVCLCFDRSRSMTFDTTGTNESWPASELAWPYGIPSTVTVVRYNNRRDVDYRMIYPPCNGSRWYYLATAANAFLNALSTSTVQTPVALITWASATNNSAWHDDAWKYYTYSGIVTTSTSTGYAATKDASKSITSFSTYTADSGFVTTYDNIRSVIESKGRFTMLGGTDMNNGLNQAVQLFLEDAKTDKTPWNRIIILFSDGYYSDGTVNPVNDAAVKAKDANIVVHTVGFLLNSTDTTRGATTLQSIANLTGGRCYIATNGEALKTAFEELARSLPVILTH